MHEGLVVAVAPNEDKTVSSPPLALPLPDLGKNKKKQCYLGLRPAQTLNPKVLNPLSLEP